MTLNIDLSPQVEAQLFAAAKLNGIAPAEVVTKVLTGKLPPLQAAREIVEHNDEPQMTDPKQAEAIAMLESIIAEVPTDPEELRKANEEFEEFKQNLNRNRIESGERPLFP